MIDARAIATSNATRPPVAQRTWPFVAAAAALAVVLASAVLYYSSGDRNVLAPALAVAALCLVPIVWERPHLGLYLLVVGAVLFEDGPLGFGLSITDQVPFLDNLNQVTGLPGLFINPAEALAAGTLAVVVVQRRLRGETNLEGGPLFVPFTVLIAILAVSALHGVATGGAPKIALWSVRGLGLMYIAYLLAVNLIRDRRQVDTLLLLVIAGVVFKSLIALWRYFVDLGGDLDRIRYIPNVNSLMAHEESFFFLAVILLAVVHLVYGGLGARGRLSLLALPIVVFPFLANQRRVGTAALLLGIFALLVITYALFRQRRELLVGLVLMAAVVAPVYVTASWESNSVVAAPVQAIRSGIDPGERDQSSNDYRRAEDANLTYTIERSPLWGNGLGKPMIMREDLAAIGGTFTWFDTMPHNSILWLAMTTGVIGVVAFWFLISAVVAKALAAVRAWPGRPAGAVAAFALLTALSYVTFALFDGGLYSQRLGIFTGAMIAIAAMTPVLFADGPAALKEARP